ncbi:heavy metal translocating P-type ATPase [Alcanivorax quisquiliarum]|uniref:Cadmium-translocating P-type ATPase n=1 Tax=Alcanivorax quisquiliarum TaxID=2933565 RepID=A0ABT0EA25_9GAMM|nr:cadmium-translocating P-type ATPase [Alcanivorax quisquiliarum]
MSTACWHCGEDTGSTPFTARTPDGLRNACCAGCAAAVEMIHRMGLSDYYQLRTENAPLAALDENDRTLALFDMPALVAPHRRPQANGHDALRLQLGSLRCAACCWLIEQMLTDLPGVHEARVNLATMQLSLEIDQGDLALPRQIAERLLRLGYSVTLPGDPRYERDLQKEKRRLLGRVMLAGLGAMQAMMYSFVLYLNVFDPSEAIYESMLRLTSLLIATPVVFYAGWPFFSGAWHGLKQRQLTMDLPIAIALLLAWGGSLVNMALGGSHVYFDSAAMFVFFLLISRALEQRQQHRVRRAWQRLQDALPQVVQRLRHAEPEWISVQEIQPGDILLLAQGDTVPVDGIVHEGEGDISEAAITGEPLPARRVVGDTLPAGGKVLEGRVQLRATGTVDSSLVAQIAEQVSRAAEERVTVVRDWQRVAPLFIGASLLLAVVTLAIHWEDSPALAFEHMLALLVITCPCALALAVPLGVSATLSTALREGILVASPKQLLALNQVRGVLFDKTGTLTLGDFQLTEFLDAASPAHPESLTQRLAIAAALESDHPHPLARAFDGMAADQALTDVRISREGAEGKRQGVHWRISGDPAYARPDSTCLLLSRNGEPSVRFWLTDQLRPETTAVLERLRRRGLTLRLASGDARSAVESLARQLPLVEARGQMTPTDKAAWLAQLAQAEGPQMMVGDGINDAPALLKAAVSVAPASATSLARRAAGLYLLDDNLRRLPALPDLAARSRQLIHQNLFWAVLYNVIAVPLAMAGFVTPWAAALGMAASSLVVTLNANRMNRWKASSC